MKLTDYLLLENFFNNYSQSFISRAADPAPHILKTEHTRRVCDNIEWIARQLGTTERTILVAKAAALLHDIGRFPQYETYKTFSDRSSANHAVLSVRVIRDHQPLNTFPQDEQKQIIKAVALHNVLYLSEKLSPNTLWLTRLLRDADKIDILKVMTGLYSSELTKEKEFITWDMKDNGRISGEVLEKIYKKEIIDNAMVSTINDLKLLQISWIFDINFQPTLKKLDDLGYIPQIIKSMPPSAEIDHLDAFIGDFFHSPQGYVEDR